MTRILFICHGNICRSPMAEYVFKDMVRKAGLENDFEIDSAATSREEIGNDIYPPAKAVLTAHGVPFERRHARRMTQEDLDYYDFIVAMEEYNLHNIARMFGRSALKKMSLLMDYTDRPGDVSDPWYTRDFETAYRDIEDGCEGMMLRLGRRNNYYHSITFPPSKNCR